MSSKVYIEYIIIIKQEGTFCNSEEAFLKFLSIDSSLNISPQDNEITFNSKKSTPFKVSYAIESNLTPSKQERYFKLDLSSNDEDRLDEFNELTSSLEKMFLKLHPDVGINVLWNDIARKYAIKGYALINEVENLLRRLIANFMLTNVGYDFPKTHIPHDVESRDPHLKTSYSDYLYKTYFTDLNKILFQGQRDVKLRYMEDIQRIVQKSLKEGKKEILVEDLKGVIATSLWEKHFKKDTTYKGEDLEKDLEKLSILRNDIAHNSHISRKTLGIIENISTKIIRTLKLEIEDLPNKQLSAEEQEFQVISENIRIADNSSTIDPLSPIISDNLIFTINKNDSNSFFMPSLFVDGRLVFPGPGSDNVNSAYDWINSVISNSKDLSNFTKHQTSMTWTFLLRNSSQEFIASSGKFLSNIDMENIITSIHRNVDKAEITII